MFRVLRVEDFDMPFENVLGTLKSRSSDMQVAVNPLVLGNTKGKL